MSFVLSLDDLEVGPRFLTVNGFASVTTSSSSVSTFRFPLLVDTSTGILTVLRAVRRGLEPRTLSRPSFPSCPSLDILFSIS